MHTLSPDILEDIQPPPARAPYFARDRAPRGQRQKPLAHQVPRVQLQAAQREKRDQRPQHACDGRRRGGHRARARLHDLALRVRLRGRLPRRAGRASG